MCGWAARFSGVGRGFEAALVNHQDDVEAFCFPAPEIEGRSAIADPQNSRIFQYHATGIFVATCIVGTSRHAANGIPSAWFGISKAVRCLHQICVEHMNSALQDCDQTKNPVGFPDSDQSLVLPSIAIEVGFDHRGIDRFRRYIRNTGLLLLGRQCAPIPQVLGQGCRAIHSQSTDAQERVQT